MATSKLKPYPVGNGDTTLIILSDNTSILVDCKIRDCDTDSNDAKVFDVKKDLIDSLQKSNSAYHLDLFILTHPDKDHCHGYATNFFLGSPSDYSEKDEENGLIISDELWITSTLFDQADCEDAKALKKEAERRLSLYNDNSPQKDEKGNRLRMIGYNGDEKYDSVPNSTPGEKINKINGDDKQDFEFFIHSPFKSSLIEESAEKGKNFSSIVMQARFKISETESVFYLFGGDADHYIWEQILAKSKKHENLDKLEWDYFLAPHHVSWTFFNSCDDSGEEPKNSSIEILQFRRNGGKLFASCKPIIDDDDNPPHHDAMNEYLKHIPKTSFIKLFETNSSGDPIVIEYEIANEKKQTSNTFARPAPVQIKSIESHAITAKQPWAKV